MQIILQYYIYMKSLIEHEVLCVFLVYSDFPLTTLPLRKLLAQYLTLSVI